MTPEQFSYLSTLAGVLPTLWVALAVIAMPRSSLILSKRRRAVFLTFAVGGILGLPALVEGVMLYTLSDQVNGHPYDPLWVRLLISWATGITAGQAASIVIVLGFATAEKVAKKVETTPEAATELPPQSAVSRPASGGSAQHPVLAQQASHDAELMGPEGPGSQVLGSQQP
ncbi:hypothetical protein [Propionicimonas sp.]|uniref:hypothetical protein n=1 Tax=Propionicimonas sp. TaxID=1955623 RepID=UPI0039E72941